MYRVKASAAPLLAQDQKLQIQIRESMHPFVREQGMKLLSDGIPLSEQRCSGNDSRQPEVVEGMIQSVVVLQECL